MRADSVGLFWEEPDEKTEKKKDLLRSNDWVEIFPGFWMEQWRVDKGQDQRSGCVSLDLAWGDVKARAGKREPPEPVWLEPDYLPFYDIAANCKYDIFTDQELVNAANDLFLKGQRHKLVFDIESYWNYSLVAFKSVELGKIVYFECFGETQISHIQKLIWLVDTFTIISFNGIKYDVPILTLALAGKGSESLKAATNMLIEGNERGWQVLRRFKVKKLQNIDHVDIIDVAPRSASLKIYGGRAGCKRMQDLPFHPSVTLTEKQIAVLRWYCVNDLDLTLELFEALGAEMQLRREMSAQYGLDLRSKSDAQIAEAVIVHEVEKMTGAKTARPSFKPGESFKYIPAPHIQFTTPMLQNVLQVVCNADFVVSEYGKVLMPDELSNLKVTIGNCVYKLGLGGLHSQEKSAAHVSTLTHYLVDKDVTSYYPYLILNLGMFPEQLGPNFLTVLRNIVETRVAAKKAGDKKTAGSLKIVVNGTFGKLSDPYSRLYSPDQMIRTTLTGQLSLLMLIEAIELAGIPAVSANTDGVVMLCPNEKTHTLNKICAGWQHVSGLNLEDTFYEGLYSLNVNNYVAVHKDFKDAKGKGVFADPSLEISPQTHICVDAIKQFLLTGKPVGDSIRECQDITKFVSIRTVNGGAVKNGEYLGKAVRWYYAKDERDEIIYAKTGNKVSKSDGGKPLMELPESFPDDVNYDWYEREANTILKDIGYAV